MSKPSRTPTIPRIYAALATPRRADSTEVDAAAFFTYQDAVVQAGVDGLVLFGSTGEFVHFSLEDRTQAAGLVIKRSRIPVLINVSHSTIEGALDLAEGALNAGAAGLLIMPPYFYRYTDAQLLAFYGRFAERAGGRTPLYLYNLPFFTNPLSFSLIAPLLSAGHYVGIKDSSGDPDLLSQLSQLHRVTPFTWFVGSESLYFQACREGADGTVSGLAGAIPELMLAFDRAISSKDFDAAARLNLKVNEFLLWLEKLPATIAIKQAAAVRGWIVDYWAFPFDHGTRNDIKAFQSWFRNWLPEVLAECSQSSRSTPVKA